MDADCEALLQAWELPSLIPIFKENLIDLPTLRLINSADVESLIKEIGLRARFRHNWSKWLAEEESGEVQSIGSTFKNFLNEINLSTPSLSDIQVTPVVDPNDPTCFSTLEPLPGTSQASSSHQQTWELVETQNTGPTSPRHIQGTNSLVWRILNKTVDGKTILSEGRRQGGLLPSKRRKELGRVVVRGILDENPSQKISGDTFQQLSAQIQDIFPKEGSSVFYSKPSKATAGVPKRNASGILYEAYIGRRRKLRQIGVLSPSTRSSTSSVTGKSGEDEDLSGEATVETSDISEQLQWLRNSVDPWNLVETYWSDTVAERLKELQQNQKSTVGEYLDLYPALKLQQGLSLLEQDFVFLFPGKEESLFHNIVLTRDKIISCAERKRSSIRDKDVKKQIDNLLSSLTDDVSENRSFTALLLLPYLLPVSPGGSRKKGYPVWKPSRSEIRDGFVTTVSCETNITTVVEERKKKLESLKRSFQPLVIAVGEPPASAKIVVDNTFYLTPSPLAAVDLTFKLFHATGACYPEEASDVWLFIQKAFYGITTKFDKQSQGVLNLIGDLDLAV